VSEQGGRLFEFRNRASISSSETRGFSCALNEPACAYLRR